MREGAEAVVCAVSLGAALQDAKEKTSRSAHTIGMIFFMIPVLLTFAGWKQIQTACLCEVRGSYHTLDFD